MAVDNQLYEYARVGELKGADAQPLPSRAARMGSLITADGQGKYYEQTSRGNVFSLVLTSCTTSLAAGNIMAAAAAASANFAVWNPTGSGKNISLLKAFIIPISGTSPVSGVYHSYMTVNPTIANVAVTPLACNNVGMSASSIAGYCTSAAGATLTGCSALKVIRPMNLYISAGTFASLGGVSFVDVCDGDIVIPPGFGWVPTFSAAGSTFLTGFGVEWEEIYI